MNAKILFILKDLKNGPVSLEDIRRHAGRDAVRSSYKKGYIINRIGRDGIGRLSITGAGLNALEKEEK